MKMLGQTQWQRGDEKKGESYSASWEADYLPSKPAEYFEYVFQTGYH